MFSTTLIAIGPVGPIGMTAVAERWYTPARALRRNPIPICDVAARFPTGGFIMLASRVSAGQSDVSA